eukprot:TRINITY_DN1698_c0_g1_i1.p2 TRINITY_DN1698_c0_g1~~TRINITY_DN1698_c0_g1_i1.p2  ORF type:complete len:177 (-),score=33.85 TRINITY_DN1698_c0_g1_i1:1-531(-)
MGSRRALVKKKYLNMSQQLRVKMNLLNLKKRPVDNGKKGKLETITLIQVAEKKELVQKPINTKFAGFCSAHTQELGNIETIETPQKKFPFGMCHIQENSINQEKEASQIGPLSQQNKEQSLLKSDIIIRKQSSSGNKELNLHQSEIIIRKPQTQVNIQQNSEQKQISASVIDQKYL